MTERLNLGQIALLSRAYPFVVAAFALTPVLGALVVAEPLSARLLVGIAVTACGLVLVVGQ